MGPDHLARRDVWHRLLDLVTDLNFSAYLNLLSTFIFGEDSFFTEITDEVERCSEGYDVLIKE